MRLEFYIDPETGEPHIHAHDVRESEVEEALTGDGLRWRAGDGKTIVIGQTGGGGFLQIIFVELGKPTTSIFVITAYPAKKELIAAYRRRMRKKGKQ